MTTTQNIQLNTITETTIINGDNDLMQVSVFNLGNTALFYGVRGNKPFKIAPGEERVLVDVKYPINHKISLTLSFDDDTDTNNKAIVSISRLVVFDECKS